MNVPCLLLYWFKPAADETEKRLNFVKNLTEIFVMPKKANALVHEKSPYLLQHAYNPVAWYAWGDEAFTRAEKEDKPIFLSIGYSTCHWCHVMERESFEDEEVAALLNDAFIAIKVDREERPDVDNVYMTVCQMLTGSGGWPLTIFMTPEKKPFFAGTYIPKQSRFGRLGMMELIPEMQRIWQQERHRILDSADEITRQLQSTSETTSGVPLQSDLLQRTFIELSRHFDETNGGFHHAPKFPTPHNLLFLLRYYARTKNERALHMVEHTLLSMRRGGIFDHIGFGFHRYSTDHHWLVPHFEKMLYDQAMLILAYAEAFQLTRKQVYADTVREIVSYVQRDMTSPDGGFYSAEDADSEGEEGKFYVWTKKEITDILGKEADWFCELFQIRDGGNFVDEATHQKTGTNILFQKESLLDFVARHGLDADTFSAQIETMRQKVFAVREQRIHPHKDDKILTDWNGLMIAALATAGRILGEPTFIDAAHNAAAFIEKNLTDQNGDLLHRYRDGEAAIPAFADDYAFYIWGLYELHQSTQQTEYLELAIDRLDILRKNFWDEQNGGFFTTARNSEKLLIRHKEIYDGAIPSVNSVAMSNLVRLARLTGRSQYEELADQLGRAFAETVSRQPSAYTFLMSALDFATGPSFEIIIVGETETTPIFDSLNALYLPSQVVIHKKEKDSRINDLADFVKDFTSLGGKPTIYVCRDFACHQPTTDVQTMLKILAEEV